MQTTTTAEPNVTPMLDVLLVLLIIFLSMVIQVHHSVDVQLPIPCTGQCGAGESIVLEVRPGPEYRVNQRPIAAGRLRDELTSIYRGRPRKILEVAGDPGVTYQQVVSAIDVAHAAGVVEVAIRPRQR